MIGIRRRPRLARPLLLITPKGQTWLPEPPAHPRQPVVIVIDVLEESWRTLRTPTLSLHDRQAFLQTQVALEIAGNALWAMQVSSQVPWPRSVTATVCVVANPQVQQVLQSLLEQQQPIMGVWTLTVPLLRLMRRIIPRDGGYHIGIYQARHASRVVVVQGQQPLYTRLIPADAQGSLVDELAATVRFLQDHGTVPRTQPLQYHLLGCHDAGLSAAGCAPPQWQVHPEAVTQLEDLLARVGPGLPWQLATAEQRRYHLARLARQGGHAAMGLASLALLGGLGLQWQALAQVQLQKAALRSEVNAQQSALQALQQELAATQVDVALLRQALQLPHLRPDAAEGDVDLVRAIASTQRWLADLPLEVEVKQWQWQRRAACTPAAQRLAEGAAPAPGGSALSDRPQADSLQIDIDLARVARSAERERWFEHLERRLQADPGWAVIESPMVARGARALRAGATQDQQREDGGTWCLVRRVSPAAVGAESIPGVPPAAGGRS